MPYTPIVGIIGYVLHPDGERVLLVHRSRDGDQHQGKNNGLGGKLEADEDVVACLHRELMEEAGITVTAQRLRGTISWPGFGLGGEHWLGFLFVVDAFDGEVPPRNDDGPLEWVPIERLLGVGDPPPMWEGDRHFLPMVFDDDPRPFYGVLPYLDGQATSWVFHR